ncbi:hypothetical protein R1flu_011458 [Riccia fluitans]|uniref:FAD-binding PCMH-type domain-containing protein n=1 Tax=Riccia fluitans TaxID=41844 RepID=A0ABD1Z7W5_9MARC
MGTIYLMLHLFIVTSFTIVVTSSVGEFDSKLTGSEAVTERDDEHTLYGSGGFIKCTSDELVQPISTQEVSDLLQKLNADGKPFKVLATRRGRHTRNSRSPTAQADTGGRHDGANLADAAVRNGMSVSVGVLPVYGNLTVGGIISACAHGTGAGVDSSLGDIVIGLKWVNGRGNIISSKMDNDNGLQEIRELVGGLGALEVITEVTFQLLPPGALAQVETWQGDDSDFAADVKHQLESSTPHIPYFWRPDLGYYKAFHFKPLQPGDVPINPYHPNGRSAMLMAGPQEFAMAMQAHMRDYTLDYDDSDVKSVIKAEEEERQKHLNGRYGEGKVKLCLNPGLFWFRFGKGSKNLLATWAGHEEPVLYAMSTFFASSYVPHLLPKMDHISETSSSWRSASTRPGHITARTLIAHLLIPSVICGIVSLRRTLPSF